MILVLLGTQNNSFHRLLEEIDKLIKNGVIKDKVIVQAGYTKFKSKNMKIFTLIPKEKLEKYQKDADIIITHGGVGSIISSIKEGKKVIAVPRLHEYGEHVNDHQLDIIKSFNDAGYIIGIQDVSELPEALKNVRNMVPRKYVTNTGKILQLVSDFIDNH